MMRADHGFSLLEVTVAAGILVVVALGTAQLFGLALRQTSTARDYTFMTILAARALDQLAASAGVGTISASPPDCLERDCAGFSDMAGQGGGLYARRWIVSFPAVHHGATAAIVVRVFRPDALGSRVEIASLVEVAP